MEYGPGIMPAVSFSERSPPFHRIEVLREVAVAVFAAHQAVRSIEQVLIVLAAFLVDVQFRCGSAQFFPHLIDTPVIVGVFKGTGGTLTDIGRYISQFIVFLVAHAAGRRNRGMLVVCSMQQTFIHFLGILFDVAFHIGICHY